MNMKRLMNSGAILVAAALVQTVARADYIDLPIKWSQPIGTNTEGIIIGADRVSDSSIPWIMADDWLCTDPMPVWAVRWWGSYAGETTPRGVSYVPFNIGIYATAGSHPSSKPGEPPLLTSVSAQEQLVGIDQAGDFVYEYNAYLRFAQVYGTEYFLSIDKPTGENWGWHDSGGQHPVLDYAAVSLFGYTGPWATFQPKTDLAFELMVPEPSGVVLGLVGGGLVLVIALRRRR
jgi:hypothetical protein